MGMPGSTEHLDELMSRVLGELMQEGICVKLADDLYTGGDTLEDLLDNWERILQCFEKNNLRLSAIKTEICPTTCTILGWVWSQGKISVSPHKITPLKSTPPPPTVKALRSWLGAYKHLRVCLPGHAMLLASLEKSIAGMKSQARIDWSSDLLSDFKSAQAALDQLTSIYVPNPQDKLIITTDAAVKIGGIGAVLHIIRGSKTLVAGFFSARLKSHQVRWLPCEVEALAISTAIQHWAPYIIENQNTVQVLTDSRPCVQAQQKLSRGEFSSSARVSSFLSTISRYNVSIQYITGAMNIPADYQSRNPAVCLEASCQVCKFIDECDRSTVCNITVTDVLQGKSNMPFLTPGTWKGSQQDCPTLRRVYAHLTQGTRPGKKATKVRNLKRYLQVCSIGKDGMLVVRKQRPFAPSLDLTVIPTHILPGLLSALHLRLQHPTKLQLAKVFHRYFYALDSDQCIDTVTGQCPQCASIAKLPRELEEFTTSGDPPELGSNFACDVLCRARQRIFILRDSFSSFTVTKLLPDEKCSSLKDAIIESTAELMSPKGCIVRVDGAPSLQSLVNDIDFQKLGIQIETGRLKNRNKNPVGEKAVRELEDELKRYSPDGVKITSSALALVTATLNKRVRNRGLTAKEIITQRESLTGDQLNFSDELLAKSQHEQRISAHGPSSRSHARTSRPAVLADVNLGDLVYIKCEGDKHTARDIYIVTRKGEEYLYAQKLKGHQFRSRLYKLKYSEVFKVPCTHARPSHQPVLERTQSDSSDDDDDDLPSSSPCHSQVPPAIPPEPPPGSPSGSDGNDSSSGEDTDHEQPYYTKYGRLSKRPPYLKDYTT